MENFPDPVNTIAGAGRTFIWRATLRRGRRNRHRWAGPSPPSPDMFPSGGPTRRPPFCRSEPRPPKLQRRWIVETAPGRLLLDGNLCPSSPQSSEQQKRRTKPMTQWGVGPCWSVLVMSGKRTASIQWLGASYSGTRWRVKYRIVRTSPPSLPSWRREELC